MDYQVEEVSQIKRKINVQVPVEEVMASLGATIAMYRDKADVRGFRKGKVPSSIVESMFRKDIYSEAANDLVNLHINEILGSLKMTPVSRIDFDGGEMVKGEPFNYALLFEVLPEFEIPNFEGAPCEETIPEVDETEIQAVFDRIRNQLAELAPADEARSPKDGDVVVISFSASENGVPLPGIKAENFELTLGQNQALPAFEDLVKSLVLDQTGEAQITFPEDFLNPDMAGKTLAMSVTLHALKVKKLPELDDAFAKKAGGFADVAAMREAINKSYMESRRQLQKSVAQKKLLDGLMAQVDYPVPETMVEQHMLRMINELEGRLESMGKSVASTGKSLEDIRAGYREEAEGLARSEIFLLGVAKKHELTVTEKEIDFFFRQMAARSGQDYQELKDYHIQNNLMFAVSDRLLSDKAMELIYSKAAITLVPAVKAEEAAPAGGES